MDLSHLDWPSILVTAILASLGSVAGMAIKQWFDRSLEEKKVHWERASWIHQRQVDTLSRLYLNLHNMQDDLQGATRLSRLESEINPEEYMKRFYQDSSSARSDFVANKLLLASAVVLKCNDLFEEFLKVRITLGSAGIVIGDGVRLDLLREAQKIAHERIPTLLQEIERSAREIIHEESGPN